MAWTTITGANTGSIPGGVLKTDLVFDGPAPDLATGMSAGWGVTIIASNENPSFNPIVMKEQYDKGLAAGGGSTRPVSGLVFPRGS